MLAQYTEDQRDCLQEICNVALGQAADSLARKLDVFVTLPIPVINIIEANQLAATLSSDNAEDGIFAVSQLFASKTDGSALSGLAVVVLSEASLDELKVLMPELPSVHQLVKEAGQLMAQSCLDALSEQWDLNFKAEEPLLEEHQPIESLCKSLVGGWKTVLLVEINYQLEGRQFNGDLLLLFPDQAIAALAQRLDQLLA